jgi:hypothetical protein
MTTETVVWKKKKLLLQLQQRPRKVLEKAGCGGCSSSDTHEKVWSGGDKGRENKVADVRGKLIKHMVF